MAGFDRLWQTIVRLSVLIFVLYFRLKYDGYPENRFNRV